METDGFIVTMAQPLSVRLVTTDGTDTAPITVRAARQSLVETATELGTAGACCTVMTAQPSRTQPSVTAVSTKPGISTENSSETRSYPMARNKSESYRRIQSSGHLLMCAEEVNRESELIVSVTWNQNFANMLQDYWRSYDRLSKEIHSLDSLNFRFRPDVYHCSGHAREWLESLGDDWGSDVDLTVYDALPDGIEDWHLAQLCGARLTIERDRASFSFWADRGGELFDTGGQIYRADTDLFRDAE